jgi:hypothetical protein
MLARSDDLRLAVPLFLADALVCFSILLAMHFSHFNGKEADNGTCAMDRPTSEVYSQCRSMFSPISIPQQL